MNKVQLEKLATCEERNRRRMQNETLQRVKVQHEREQYLKECNLIKGQHEKFLHKKVQHGNGAV